MSPQDARQHLKGVRRVVLKLGTRMLTTGPYTLDTEALARLAIDIADLRKKGYEIIVVSSGAIAAGMGRMNIHTRPTSIPVLQALAAIGQNLLMNAYEKALGQLNIPIAQVLLTIDDIHHRKRFVNVQNTLNELIQMEVVPIVNENDTVGTEEVKIGRVGDNDNLSSYVLGLANADLLVLFTDVDGLLDIDPRKGEGRRISVVNDITPDIEALAGGSGDPAAVGGMRTKIEAARHVLSAGGMMLLANGRKHRLTDILKGDDIGTMFCPVERGLHARHHWIAMTARVRGRIHVDEGAARAIESRNASLLPKGITGVDGQFEIGDVVSVLDPSGREIARGVVQYERGEIERIKGRHSTEIDRILGYSSGSTIIHRDDLVAAYKL